MNLKFYLKKMKSTDLSRFKDTAKRVSQKTGKPWLYHLADIFICTAKYGSGHVDYESFGMYEKSAAERGNILTVGKNNKLFKTFNDTRYIPYFEDKAIFNKKFAPYLKRDWMLVGEGVLYGNVKGSALTEADCVEGQGKEAFRAFLADKDEIMVKPLDLSCGKGIEKLRVADWDSDALYDYLLANNKPLVEEVVKQHHTMNLLSSYSVNTIRMISILKDGEARFVSGGIRMGKPGSVVDNFNNGGISTIFDIRTGKIISDGYDKERTVYETVPETGVTLKGFQIPQWEEIKAMVAEAAKLVPQVGYVGWDVCVSEEYGPLLIEGNSYPAQDLSQEPSLNAGTWGSIMEALQ